MNIRLMLVTFQRDYPFLRFCLKSIRKYCTGFNGLTILVPIGQSDGVKAIPEFHDIHKDIMPIDLQESEEWPGRGMMFHMFEILCADKYCPHADFIGHIDADCVFNAPVTPNDYVLQDGKAILRYERFDIIGQRHHGVMAWQAPTAKCLPFEIKYESMRCLPLFYHRDTYAETRRLMEVKTGIPVEEYLKSVKHTYPEGWCEHNTLGNVAMHVSPDRYHFVEQHSDMPTPDNKMFQTWSRATIDEPVNLWIRGQQRMASALDIFREVGLE